MRPLSLLIILRQLHTISLPLPLTASARGETVLTSQPDRLNLEDL